MTQFLDTQLSLLERARLRDGNAWSQLVELYSPLIVRWCARSGLSKQEIADCVQEVFLSVSRSLDSFTSPGTVGAFRGWMWTITRNKLRDAFRHRSTQFSAAGGSSALRQLNSIPDFVLESSEDPSTAVEFHQLVHRAMEQVKNCFEENTWQAFWRSVVDGIRTEVVARELGLSCASVRQARSRILRRVRQQLGDLNEA